MADKYFKWLENRRKAYIWNLYFKSGGTIR